MDLIYPKLKKTMKTSKVFEAHMKKTDVAKDPYLEKCKEIMQTYPEEIRRIFHYPDCELEFGFLGFLENYEVELPKDFTVIDLGCYQGVQSVYFKDQQQYIGVDVATPTIWRMMATDNVASYQCTIQNFIRDILPHLNLDLNKTFAICSYVPDEEARAMMRETFPYYRDVYGNEMQEKLPVIHKITNATKETHNMTQKTEKERYIGTLLKINARLSELTRTEIDALFSGRGHSSEEFSRILHEALDDGFNNGISYEANAGIDDEKTDIEDDDYERD